MTRARNSLLIPWTPPWRWPEITALCMDFSVHRQVRLELRILRPAHDADWCVRRIEWLEPVGVVILGEDGDRRAAASLETDLRPRGRDGAWFEGGATIWAHYPFDKTTAHRVRLRLTLERAGKSRRIEVETIFPAMDWTAGRARAVRQRFSGVAKLAPQAA